MVIKSLGRLGRNYDDMTRELEIIIREKGATLVVIDLPLLDTRNKSSNYLTSKRIANLVIQLFSYAAETERTMHQRTMEGLAAAEARGVKLGRKPLGKPQGYENIRAKWKERQISARQAAKRLGVSSLTFLKWVKENVSGSM